MEKKIDQLIEHNMTYQPKLPDTTSAQIDGSEDDDDDGMDRKRLKERLKKSISKVTKHSDTAPTRTDWMEYFFGICLADQRLGKEGSR
jgi:hypothetical protein